MIFVQFLLLFGANVIVYRIGTRLFDRRTDIAAVAALLVVEELAFIRHYTATLLSENLYFFAIAVTLYLFVTFVERGDRRTLLGCAIAAGFSALTRPAMMLYLVPAAGIVAIVTYRDRRSRAQAAGATALIVCAWLLTLSPATI